MKILQIKPPRSTREVVQTFGGLNRGARIQEGEWAEEKNMCARHYPVMSTRERRGKFGTIKAPGGLVGADRLYWVDGPKLMAIGVEVDLGLNDTVPKQIVQMGAKLIIWPDRVWYNTATEEHGSLDNTVKIENPTVLLTPLCDREGKDYKNVTVAEAAPKDPVDGQLWLQTSDKENLRLKKRDTDKGIWLTVRPVFVKLNAAGINKGFKTGDTVRISGLTGELEKYNGDRNLVKVAENYVVFEGITDQTGLTPNAPVALERKAPQLDYIIECNNRIWGCYYGTTENGERVNELYASALGDPENWSVYRGNAADSWRASRGSTGPWTGAATIRGCPVFFKQDCLDKIYINPTGAHQVETMEETGVQIGCWRSIAKIGQVIYYYGADGVYAYDGTVPYKVSREMDPIRGYDARAGAERGVYYIYIYLHGGKRQMMTYDTRTQVWHAEDDMKPMIFANWGGFLYWIDEQTGDIVYPNAPDTGEEIDWYAVSGEIGLQTPDDKLLRRLIIRADIEQGGELMVCVSYDGGPFEELIRWERPGLQSLLVPLVPQLHDHARLKLMGRGQAKIYSIAKTLESGGGVLL